MFLHIGENQIVKSKDIVGVFNVNILKNSDINNKILSKEEEKEKTLIITENGKYFSNVSISTIRKRLLFVKDSFKA